MSDDASAEITARLADGGFGLCAPLSISTYDRLVPEPWRASKLLADARGALVVANAGGTLWPQFLASPESELEDDPLDTYTRRIFREAVADRGAFALYQDQHAGRYLPLVALAERAGLGTPGRVGVLLHPVYGPWMSLRGIVFVREALVESGPADFDPCPGCPAPCADACHGRVVAADGVDAAACYRTRLTLDACALRCDARRACVIGPEHAFVPEQEAHHALIRDRTGS